jgi:hypothetical protein
MNPPLADRSTRRPDAEESALNRCPPWVRALALAAPLLAVTSAPASAEPLPALLVPPDFPASFGAAERVGLTAANIARQALRVMGAAGA